MNSNFIMNVFKIIKAILLQNQPLYLHFGITHRCNLSCKMCTLKDSSCNTLSLKELKRAIDIINKLGIISVSIGGGEPLLYDNLVESIKIFSNLGIETRLLTNGTLLNLKKVKKLKSAGLDHISISLDTLNKEKQNYICGEQGSWEKVINGIKVTSQFYNRNNSIPLINTVVSRLNIKELLRLADFAYTHGFYISYSPISLTRNFNKRFSFDPEDFHLIDDIFKQLKRKKRSSCNSIFNTNKFLDMTSDFLKKRKINFKCFAGKLFFSLEPNGCMYICHKEKSPSMNITEFSFKNIKNYLHSDIFQSKVNKYTDNCSNCVRPCWTEVNLFFQDINTCLERCKLHKSYLVKNLFKFVNQK